MLIETRDKNEGVTSGDIQKYMDIINTSIAERTELRYKVSSTLLLCCSTIISIVISLNIYNDTFSIFNIFHWWYTILILAVVLNCFVIIGQAIYMFGILEMSNREVKSSTEFVKKTLSYHLGKIDKKPMPEQMKYSKVKLIIFHMSIYVFGFMIGLYGLYFIINLLLG